MIRYLVERLLQAGLLLVGVSFVTFLLLYILPADPARQMAGRSATAETVESIHKQLGLDLPFHQRYARYLGSLVQGDLGRSYMQKTEVSVIIMSRLPATLLLMAGAIFFELLIGLSAGVYAAVRQGSRIDHGVMVLSFIGVSTPHFVAGILMLYVFAVKLEWFPVGGYGTLRHLILPALTLGLLGAGWYSRMMRSSM
ncbi:MAG: ABC transporter permease, partial [Gammaproteobacteria bacterium]|nr:ABC transporter permease [Gammaproteobacteria bacterium]